LPVRQGAEALDEAIVKVRLAAALYEGNRRSVDDLEIIVAIVRILGLGGQFGTSYR
jgi:hypothetical protein